MSKEIDKKRFYSILYLVCIILLINSLPFSLLIKDEIILFLINLVIKTFSVFYIFRYIKKEELNNFKTENNKSNLKLLPLVLLCCSNFVVVLFQKAELTDINYFNIFSGLIISLGVAIIEELLFRSQILEELLKTKNRLKSILISSLTFGCVHLLNISSIGSIPMILAQVAYTFFLGLVLGFIYTHSKNIVYPIIFHFLFNFINDVLVTEMFNLKWDVLFFVVNIVIGIIISLYVILLLLLEKRGKNVTEHMDN